MSLWEEQEKPADDGSEIKDHFCDILTMMQVELAEMSPARVAQVGSNVLLEYLAESVR